MQVLLVEDDPDLAELVIEYLEDEAIECDLAYHGDMALQLIAQHRYDVIVTDISLILSADHFDGVGTWATVRA